MSFILKNVDTVDSITREDFKKNYLDKRKPLAALEDNKYKWN